MRNLPTASLGIAVFVVGATTFQSPTDARREGGVHPGGGGHVGTVNRNVSAGRNVNNNLNRNISRNKSVSRNVDTNRNFYRDATVKRNKEINRNISRNVNVNRNVAGAEDRNIKYVYRNGQRGYWRNGVWIAAPAIGAAPHGYVASPCAYQYGKWQVTGSTYWRDLYTTCSKALGAQPVE